VLFAVVATKDILGYLPLRLSVFSVSSLELGELIAVTAFPIFKTV
jgi:hypothetical protein